LLLFSIVSLFFIYKKKYNFTFNYLNIFLIIFFIYIIFASILNIESNNYNNIIKSIFLLRFLVLYLVIELLLKNNKLDLQNFFIISLVCTLFVSADVIFQYIFGFDIFGYIPWDGMIAGPFEHEAIAGTYIQKFSLFSIFGFVFLFTERKYNKNLLLIVILLILFGTFFASNRISTIILIASLFALFLLHKQFRFILFLSLIIFTSVSVILINNDDVLKKKYQHMYKRFLPKIEVVEKNTTSIEDESVTKKIQLKSSLHYRIYSTVIESWKSHPLIGQGHKSFRTKCSIYVKKNKNFNCSTHPHNYHLQVLHDFGIIGYLLLSTFIFLNLIKMFKKFNHKSLLRKNYNLYFIPIVISLLVEIWPIKSTGDLFTTWNGSTVWLMIALTSIVNTNFNGSSFNLSIKNKKNFIILLSTIGFTSLLCKRIYLEVMFYSWWDRIF
jgi:O-antigen ligase